jgi:hypothetical protein
MTELPGAVRYHRDRAERFRSHAAQAKAPETREMYLRLSHREEALAKHVEQQLQATDGAGDTKRKMSMDRPTAAASRSPEHRSHGIPCDRFRRSA